MPQTWADFAIKPGVIGAGLCSIAAIAFGGIAFRRYLRNRPTPDEIERRRREAINAAGKICDGEIIEIEGPSIIYSYSVAGVGYTAAQDVTPLESMLPADVMSMIGPIALKYDPRNPANSIVICEAWSGLRKPQPGSRLA
jgi:hypothetical protein